MGRQALAVGGEAEPGPGNEQLAQLEFDVLPAPLVEGALFVEPGHQLADAPAQSVIQRVEGAADDLRAVEKPLDVDRSAGIVGASLDPG